MSATIFSGSAVKTLKKILTLNEAGTEYVSFVPLSGVDPRSTATAGNPGSLAFDISTGAVYKKLDTGTSTNWILLTAQQGTPLTWREYGNSPIITVENNHEVYLFQSGLSQSLWAEYTVPPGYIQGQDLVLKTKFYSPDSSNTNLMRAYTYHARTGVAAMTAQASRNSSNSAVTLTSANVAYNVDIDLTSSGQISPNNVVAGDILSIHLYRDSDTATSDIRFLHRQSEVIIA